MGRGPLRMVTLTMDDRPRFQIYLPPSPLYNRAMNHEVSKPLPPSEATTWHTAFYQFVPIEAPQGVIAHLRLLTADVLGSIIVASEGINGMIAGSEAQLDAFEDAMRHDPYFAGKFTHMPFKRSLCKTAPFGRMKVYQKPEIVPLGIAGVDARQTGINVTPQEWRALIAEEDVVVIDNRNSFEFRLGRFSGAKDPGVTHFRDFARYVQTHAEEWKATGKRVAMYCTGGIRCEKSSAWMRGLDLEVYQLEGGILNYFKQMPDAEKEWQGECFVFDNRVALDTHLQETETTVEQVYQDEPDGPWRLKRARELEGAGK